MTDQPTPNPDSDDALRVTVSENLVDHPRLKAILSPEPDETYGDMANDQPDPDYGITLAMQAAVQPYLDAIDTDDQNFQAWVEDAQAILPQWKQRIMQATLDENRRQHSLAKEDLKRLILMLQRCGIDTDPLKYELIGNNGYWLADDAMVSLSFSTFKIQPYPLDQDNPSSTVYCEDANRDAVLSALGAAINKWSKWARAKNAAAKTINPSTWTYIDYVYSHNLESETSEAVNYLFRYIQRLEREVVALQADLYSVKVVTELIDPDEPDDASDIPF